MPPEKDDAPTLGDIESGSGSVADALRASFAEAEKEAAPELSTDAQPEPAAEQPEKPEDASGERIRDEKGRFVAKEGDKPEADEKPLEEAQPEAAAQVETPPAAEPDPLDPPVDWSVDEQKAFRALPPDQQKFILDRVGGVAEKISEAEKSGARFKALDDVLTPYRQKWARDGFEDVAVIRQLLALTDYAREQPLKFLQEFAQSKGINLAQLAPKTEAQPDPNDPYASDPLLQRMNEARAQDRQVIQQLQHQIQQLSGTFQSRAQQEEQAQKARIDGEITTFAGEMDEKGKPKHPYFQQVRPLMSVFLERGNAPDLQTAYDMACRANPDVHAKIVAAKEYADERDRARKAQEKARAATKAGSSVSGAPGGRSEPQPTGDLRDELRAAFVQHSGTPVIQ